MRDGAGGGGDVFLPPPAPGFYPTWGMSSCPLGVCVCACVRVLTRSDLAESFIVDTLQSSSSSSTTAELIREQSCLV